ncbi:MAG: SCO family protein [Solirubrobacteraceae bacterium]
MWVAAISGVLAFAAAGPEKVTVSGQPSGYASVHLNKPAHQMPTGVLLAVILVLLAVYVAWRVGALGRIGKRLGGAMRLTAASRQHRRSVRVTAAAAVPTLLLALVVGVIALGGTGGRAARSQNATLTANPTIGPGGAMTAARPAPNFTLYNQTGQRVSLRQYRGRVVLLAFIDPECHTSCPPSAAAMLDAQAELRRTASRLVLLGVDTNRGATRIQDVLKYTELHHMAGHWNFLTGSPAALEQVRQHYGVDETALAAGRRVIERVATLYLIDPQGRIRRVFTTDRASWSVARLGRLLAQDVSRLLNRSSGDARIRQAG